MGRRGHARADRITSAGTAWVQRWEHAIGRQRCPHGRSRRPVRLKSVRLRVTSDDGRLRRKTGVSRLEQDLARTGWPARPRCVLCFPSARVPPGGGASSPSSETPAHSFLNVTPLRRADVSWLTSIWATMCTKDLLGSEDTRAGQERKRWLELRGSAGIIGRADRHPQTSIAHAVV
jgi:hypothetical protein